MDRYPDDYLKIFTIINNSKTTMTLEQFPEHLKSTVLGMTCFNILIVKDDQITISKKIPNGFKQQWKDYNYG